MKGGWKTKGKILRQQEIMDAALDLFSQKGFHNTTMAQVAQKAGVGVGTLYQHFQGKEELYHFLLEDKCNRLLNSLLALVKEEDSTEENLKRLLDAQIDFVEKHRSFFKLYLSEQLATLEAIREKLGLKADVIYTRFFHLFHGIMDRGVKKGELRDLSPAHLTRAYMGILNSFFFDWLKGELENLRENQGTILSIFMKGARK
jgi:TetR/AcrR family transcriptional regulator